MDFELFLGASKRLYNSLHWLVCPLVGPLVPTLLRLVACAWFVIQLVYKPVGLGFLGAKKRLYKRLRRLVGWSVRWSVRWSVPTMQLRGILVTSQLL
jgi:hypothetical protein